ncbi:MAG: porin, partial [Acidithiobacillus sp.]
MSHHRTSQSSRLLVHRSVLAAVALSLPMITGVAQASPLSMPAPLTFSAGPLGKLDVQGIASGMAFYQDFPQGTAGIGAKHVGADITNGMVIIQKNTGALQFYIQAGAYSFP